MDQRFEITLKRGTFAVILIGIITLAAALAAKNLLMPDSISQMGDMHQEPGPFFENLFKVYVPRKMCMFYEPGVIWLHFISDFLISLSYYSIPVALIYIVRRRQDLAFTWIFWMFAAFILLCGTTHIIGMWNLWQPLYKVDGIVKLITGVVSLFTAIALWPLIPKILALPSPAILEKRVEERTTELAQANDSIRELLERERLLRDEAETTNLLKDQFLATLSHELRTPLNAILGWAQILKKKSPEKNIADGLDIIERNSRLQARLISDLLDMSSILSGKVRLELKDINFKEVFDSAVESIKPTAEGKKITINKESPEISLPVYGDPARLQQVLWNLFSNAVKFTPTGGIITAALTQTGNILEVSISDNGVGIKPGFLPHIFDRFSQADSSITRSYGGLGLGLAVCKYLVEMHGGKIKAESDGENKGSRFSFTLPRAVSGKLQDRVIADTQADEKSLNLLKGYKILVVDDEFDGLELSKVLLTDAGAVVYTALNTKQAMEILKSNLPDLLLCDISMPGEDGYSFLKRIRELPSDIGGKIKAVALTALANPEDQAKSLQSGFARHVSKPFDHDQLLKIISDLLKEA